MIVLHKGFFEALIAGLLDASPAAPDLRLMAVNDDSTADVETDAVHLSDFTILGEFDGSGYSRYDCAGVAVTWSSLLHRFVWTCDDGTWGATLGAGTSAPKGALVILHVDGTAANDYVLAFNDESGFGVNPSGGISTIVIPDEGLFYLGQAPA
jgi:hypothetical protein